MNVQLILTQFLDRAVSLYGDKEAVVDFDAGRTFTYKQFSSRVHQLSRGLQSLGIKKNDKVAYLASNTIEMLEGFYGIYQLGAVMVPLNIRLKPSDYLFILNHSESKVLFVDQELYHFISPIKNQLNTIEKIIVHYKNNETNEIDYDEWLSHLESSEFTRVPITEEDEGSLLYTSGTTGDPKGVLLTHRNNYLHAMSAMHFLRVTDEDVYLHVLPMFHANGWGSPFYYTANGAKHICLRKATPESIFQAIQQQRVTVIHMAPTVLNSLLQYNEEHQPMISQKIRVVIAGSAPPPSFVDRVEKELGWEFIQVYGMTESSPFSLGSRILSQYADLPAEEQSQLKAKAGIPFIGMEVKVVDGLGKEVPHDGKTFGEIMVRSHGVMKGYWRNESATMETIVNGWLHTGDVGTIDERGYIEITDRKKDIIISGGENISSIEVEGVLYDHPAVLEAAVIAIPHEKWGETPHAFIVVKENMTITEQELIDFSRSKLAHFKAITSVTFVSELPKTASGKIQKVHLRKQIEESLI